MGWMDKRDDVIAVRDAVPLRLVRDERTSTCDVYVLCCGECLDSLRVCAGPFGNDVTDEHVTYNN